MIFLKSFQYDFDLVLLLFFFSYSFQRKQVTLLNLKLKSKVQRKLHKFKIDIMIVKRPVENKNPNEQIIKIHIVKTDLYMKHDNKLY